MTRVSNSNLSIDEVVATLRNSILPTLIVEGRSDMALFHNLEEMCLTGSVDIMPVGCRRILFEVFKRRSEFSATPVAFLADSDMFLFSGIPVEYQGIIFTSGYSIENDILSGGKAFRLLGRRHSAKWAQILRGISLWFASVVHRSLAGEAVEFNVHPSQLIDFQTGAFKRDATRKIVPEESLRVEVRGILENPALRLRGHTLLDGYGHFLASVKLRPKCNKEALLSHDLVSWDANPMLLKLIRDILKLLPKTLRMN